MLHLMIFMSVCTVVCGGGMISMPRFASANTCNGFSEPSRPHAFWEITRDLLLSGWSQHLTVLNAIGLCHLRERKTELSVGLTETNSSRAESELEKAGNSALFLTARLHLFSRMSSGHPLSAIIKITVEFSAFSLFICFLLVDLKFCPNSVGSWPQVPRLDKSVIADYKKELWWCPAPKYCYLWILAAFFKFLPGSLFETTL